MALISLVPFDLAGTGLLEPFGCAFVRLHFRHKVVFSRPRNPLHFAQGASSSRSARATLRSLRASPASAISTQQMAISNLPLRTDHDLVLASR